MLLKYDTRDRVGLKQLAVDGLSLSEFVAVAFALFAFGNVAERNDVSRVLIRPETFFQQFPKAQPLLDKFMAGRALTINQMTAALASGEALSREGFLKRTGDRNFLIDNLSVFRQHPLLRLDDGRILILDLQFLSDLVTTGIYWLIFDGMPPNKRNAFRDLWGYCFEAYVINLLREFHPLGSPFLSTNVAYAGGEIDAMLDFGSEVVVIEAKGSLLTEPAKRNGNLKTFAEDVNRKFVREEDGAPKAVEQLLRATRAVAERAVETATIPRRIYPVLVSDEPACESLAFNSYLDEHFRQDATEFAQIKPLTVMSINELEELLAYTAAGTLSWVDILQARFVDERTGVWSVHQTIYDLRHARKLQVQRNRPILKRYQAIFDEIRQIFGATGATEDAL